MRLFGLPAALANYALVGWLLGTQNARAPMAILLTTNLLNVPLTVLFVLAFDWALSGGTGIHPRRMEWRAARAVSCPPRSRCARANQWPALSLVELAAVAVSQP